MNPLGPRPQTTTPLFPYPRAHYQGPSPEFISPALWKAVAGDPVQQEFCLATQISISVIPRGIFDALQIQLDPLPGWVGQSVPPWQGVSCDIGRVWGTFSIVGLPGQRRFHVLVRVPRHRLSHPEPNYILLGTQFLAERIASVHLDCQGLQYSHNYQHPCGMLLIPGQ